MAKEPDYSKMFPRRFITMSMQDKYMAVCFIYDGIQYQNLCREENPDGTFNYSEKCLSKLPYRLPGISAALDQGLTTYNDSERGLVPYGKRSNTDDFPNIYDALLYYWLEVLLLCMFSALIFHLIMRAFNKRNSWPARFLNYMTGGLLSKFKPDDEHGVLTFDSNKDILKIGKITFKQDPILGQGSKGTFVFKGRFENTIDCAVKRVIRQYLNLADREVEFLRSLQHPNLVRYLATEQDRQFVYIALELAEYTLASIVEGNRIPETGLSKVQMCRQSALGLQHLHKLNIVHRDVKPQNILISFPLRPNNDRKVMISDFGVSKQLTNMDTGHTTSALQYFDGTQGWMAPEIIRAKNISDKSLNPSKAADIFSLGCVFYYILSNGNHPFGEAEVRQENILYDRNTLANFMKDDDLFQFNDREKDLAALAKRLIKVMIRAEPGERPPISCILNYPLFWSNILKLQFLQDVSDRIEKLDRKDELINRLETGRKGIFCTNWEQYLCNELKAELVNHRTYRVASVKDLLRVIRNKKHHYRESSDAVKKSLGDVPDGFMYYFSSRFPDLLPHVFNAIQICKEESIFHGYYDGMENFAF